MTKRIFVISIFLLVSIGLQAQADLDKLITGKEVLLVEVLEVAPDVIKYVYPGEKVINSIHKNAVEKIVFSSGRTQTFREAVAVKPVDGPQDWKNVTISRLEFEVRGLYKMGEVSAKAKGTTILSNMNRVKDRAFRKLKIQAAMMGANVVYITNQDVEGNRFYDDSGNPTETNLSGVAYSSELPDYESLKTIIERKKVFLYSQKLYLGNNSTDIQAAYHETSRVQLGAVTEEDGFLYVQTRIPDVRGSKFRVVRFSEKSITLLYRTKNRIYNLVLINK